MTGALVSPLPFPFSPSSSASPGTGAGRELQAPRPRSPDPGGRRHFWSSTSQELQLQNSCKPGWGKGPASIPPCTQQGKHGPFPVALHFRDPDEPVSCKRRTSNKEERGGGARASIRIKFSITSLFRFCFLSGSDRQARTSPGPHRGQRNAGVSRARTEGPRGGPGHGVTSPVSCLPRLGRFRFAPSRGIRCPWQAPRERLTLPAPRAKVAFAA